MSVWEDIKSGYKNVAYVFTKEYRDRTKFEEMLRKNAHKVKLNDSGTDMNEVIETLQKNGIEPKFHIDLNWREKSPHQDFVSGLSNNGIQNTSLPQKVEYQTIELNDEFYSDLDYLYSLLNSAEKIGLTDKEKHVVIDEIKQRIKNPIEVDAVNFIGMIYNRNIIDLEKCLPIALQEATRNRPGIPEKNKRNLNNLIIKFKKMPLEEKIEYLEDPRAWGEAQDKNGYIYSDLMDHPSSVCHYDDDDYNDIVGRSPLYSALTLLDEIIEKREKREKGQDR